MSFRGTRLQELRLPQGTVWMLETLAEAKGRQQLYEHQSPQVIESLRELALIESAESSNRIEGVTVDRRRLRPLVLGNAPPRDRPEEEIVGYRRALNWVHSRREAIPLSPETCLELHALAQGGTTGDAGVWKTRPNDIIEIFPDGRREVRFRPLAPDQAPSAMSEMFLAYHDGIDQGRITPLLAVAALVLDFSSIHPFRDGNGRVSRLLWLLALYHHGFTVGRYISLERVIEQTKVDYYETLQQSSVRWTRASMTSSPGSTTPSRRRGPRTASLSGAPPAPDPGAAARPISWRQHSRILAEPSGFPTLNGTVPASAGT